MQTKNIKQEVNITAPCEEIFDSWLDSKKHGEMIGADAKIDPSLGGKFDIWDGYATCENLKIDRIDLKIVQSWRENTWPDDHFSKITLQFHPTNDNQTKISFEQTGIPDEHADDIKEGWTDYYWEPMKSYFQKTLDK